MLRLALLDLTSRLRVPQLRRGASVLAPAAAALHDIHGWTLACLAQVLKHWTRDRMTNTPSTFGKEARISFKSFFHS